MPEEYKLAYSLKIENRKREDSSNISESPYFPAWLLDTNLAELRRSLIDSSKKFGQDVTLELRVRPSLKQELPLKKVE
jgi:hypothetical protein